MRAVVTATIAAAIFCSPSILTASGTTDSRQVQACEYLLKKNIPVPDSYKRTDVTDYEPVGKLAVFIKGRAENYYTIANKTEPAPVSFSCFFSKTDDGHFSIKTASIGDQDYTAAGIKALQDLLILGGF